MVRPFVLVAIVWSLGSTAFADPAKNALSLRLRFGAGSPEESQPILDLFEINKTLDRIQERNAPADKATIVLSRDELEEAKRLEREMRFNDDPNMDLRSVTAGAETLRGELRPTNVNDLYSKRIRAVGTEGSALSGPVDGNASPVTLPRSGVR